MQPKQSTGKCLGLGARAPSQARSRTYNWSNNTGSQPHRGPFALQTVPCFIACHVSTYTLDFVCATSNGDKQQPAATSSFLTTTL